MPTLHFTLGPVQGFVAQSRRTRDLWASSWLLSQLAGEAMRSASERGTLVLPAVDSAQIGQILQKEHGGLPNRFSAHFETEEKAVAAANSATAALQNLWLGIAGKVREKLEFAFFKGAGTSEICDRQIANFWQVSWVVTPNENYFSALDRRKNWRTPSLTEEGGDHCSLMPQFQEISGWHAATERSQQWEFWRSLRASVSDLDLEPNERLCAVALVKRLFYNTWPDCPKWTIRNWPSTLYLAAVPWLLSLPNDPSLRNYANAVLTSRPSARGERFSCLKGIREATHLHEFRDIDGNFFYQRALKDHRATPLDSEVSRAPLLKHLADIHKRHGSPSPFYAILLMDGDSLGQALTNPLERTRVAQALGVFSQQVPDVVAKHNGRCVYAGGDDVLALLPITGALPCAEALREDYASSFAEAGLACATISAAILFAHYKLPFSTMIREAHRLLDDVAKDRTGRDSVALALWKGSGLASLWSVPWSHWKSAGGSEWFAELGKSITAPEGDASIELSSSFLYNIRARLGALAQNPTHEPGEFSSLDLPGLDLEGLLLSELLVGKKEAKDLATWELQRQQAVQLIRQLRPACLKVTRSETGEMTPHMQTFSIDGPLLARFITTGCTEVEQ